MTRKLLPRTTPAAVGLDPAAVRLLVERFDRLDAVHGFVLVRDGHVIAEGSWAPYTPDRAHLVFSATKCFTATAVGLAVDEGHFGLDDHVVDLFPDDIPAEPSVNLRAMTVRHLLTMATGHAADPLATADRSTGDWARKALAAPVEHEPGIKWLYNNSASHLLGVLVQRRTGQRLLDYLRPRLFDPLGIVPEAWEQDPDGHDIGSRGLALTTEELAAFGQLYLHRGQWHDRQLLPPEWVDTATAAHVDNGPSESPDWEQGYGLHFFRCRHGAYRVAGAFGQYAIVWPQHRIVLATTSGVWETQPLLDAVWESLLPALTYDYPISDEVVDTSALCLPTPAGAPASPREAAIAGARHSLDSHPGGLRAFTLSRDTEDRLLLRLEFETGNYDVPFGSGSWLPGTSDLEGQPSTVASAAAWSDDSTVEARMAHTATPFVQSLTLCLGDGSVDVSLDQNVAMGPRHLGTAIATPAR